MPLGIAGAVVRRRRTAAAGGYASLGTIRHESASGGVLTIPYDTGLGQTSSGTVGLRVVWTDVSASSTWCCGSDAKFNVSSSVGVGARNITDGRFHVRLLGGVSSSLTLAEAATTAGDLQSGVYASCICAWSPSKVLARADANDVEVSHSLDANSYIAAENVWIGTTRDSGSGNLVGSIRKAVIYAEYLSAANRTSLISLLAAEGS